MIDSLNNFSHCQGGETHAGEAGTGCSWSSPHGGEPFLWRRGTDGRTGGIMAGR